MFQIFQRYVASVSCKCCKSRSGCCICCTCSKSMLQAFVQNISSVPNVCCKCFDLVVAYVSHMLQQYILNVSSVSVLCCSKYFNVASCKCFIWMLHMFHIHVASVCSKCFIYFKRMLHQVFSFCMCFMFSR